MRSIVVLLCAFGAVRLLRHASAATRHMVWLLALAGVAFLPLLSAVAPAWSVPLPLPLPAIASVSAGAAVETAPSLDLATLASYLWLSVAAGLLLHRAGGHLRLWLILRRGQPATGRASDVARQLCREFHIRRSVRLITCSGVQMPFTWGVLRPVVVLPAESQIWSEERLRSILLHELAHVARFDSASNAAVQAICAAHWMNPLVWLAASAMRREAERACDDAVLAGGLKASTYAGALLHAATHAECQPALQPATAWARRSDLQQRILAILDPSTARRPLTPMRAGAATIVAIALLLPLAGVRPAGPQPEPQPPVFAATMPEAPLLESPAHLPERTAKPARRAAPRVTRPQPRLPLAEDAVMVAVAAPPAGAIPVESVVMVLYSPQGTAVLQLTTFRLPPAPLPPLGRI